MSTSWEMCRRHFCEVVKCGAFRERVCVCVGVAKLLYQARVTQRFNDSFKILYIILNINVYYKEQFQKTDT